MVDRHLVVMVLHLKELVQAFVDISDGQFDVLFDEMTCRQHLVMICRIKDMDPEMME